MFDQPGNKLVGVLLSAHYLAAYLGQMPSEGRTYAEGTQLVIDEEVSRILSEAAQRAQAILSQRRAALDAVIDLLLEKETISGVELMDVVRRSIDTAEPVALSH